MSLNISRGSLKRKPNQLEIQGFNYKKDQFNDTQKIQTLVLKDLNRYVMPHKDQEIEIPESKMNLSEESNPNSDRSLY